MAYILLGLSALLVALLVTRGFTMANPAALAMKMRFLSGFLVVGVGVVLALRGRIELGLFVALAGWGLIMGRNILPWGGGGSGAGTGQGSAVKTDHLEMELDHASGAVHGQILKGRHAGREIETLSPAELVELWQDYSFADPNSAQILEAYLDRRHPSWRDDLERQGGDAESGDHETAPPSRSGRMTRQEALQILGLSDGVSEDDVRSAHRELMKKVHPDRGGSNYLASKINEAKAVLVGD